MERLPERTPELWFERICGYLGLSFFAGVLLIGTLPPDLTFFVASYSSGAYDVSTSRGVLDLLSLTAMIPIPAVFLYGSKYLIKTVSDLSTYTAARRTSAAAALGLERLGSLKFVVITSVPIFTFTLFLPGSRGVFLGGSAGILLSLLVVLAAVYLVLILATLVWVFGYSMYVIHRLASEPTALGSFGEDRYLGLRPFGIAAFRLTLVYLGALAVLAIHSNIPPLPALFLLGFLSLFFLAIPLLLLPLRTLHQQLVAAKVAELDWIGRRYSVLFSDIKSRENPRIDDGLKGDLVALTSLRQLQEDVTRAPTWPFDTRAVTQFAAILLSISGVLASGIIRDIFHF